MIDSSRFDIKSLSKIQRIAVIALVVLSAIGASILKDFDVSLFGSEIKWPFNDKVTHFCGAGLFGFLAVIISEKRIRILGQSFHLLLMTLIIFSIAEESSQILRPNRGFSFGDMAANLLGIFTFYKIGERCLKKEIIIR